MNTLKHAPHTGVKLHIERRYIPQIINLLNSAHYLLTHAFIVIDKDLSAQLIVKCSGRPLTAEPYDTVKGAKIAFIKFFKIKAFNDGIKPIWSKPYRPDIKWLDEKMAGIRREN
jgi:hypothetical protein